MQIPNIVSLINKKLAGDGFEIHQAWPLSYGNNDTLSKEVELLFLTQCPIIKKGRLILTFLSIFSFFHVIFQRKQMRPHIHMEPDGSNLQFYQQLLCESEALISVSVSTSFFFFFNVAILLIQVKNQNSTILLLTGIQIQRTFVGLYIQVSLSHIRIIINVFQDFI